MKAAIKLIYTKRCGNCHSILGKNDEYCRNCGFPVGEGDFNPYFNKCEAVYGPPMIEYHTCPKCNYTWSQSGPNGILEDSFCPKCGNDNLENEIESYSLNDINILVNREKEEELIAGFEIDNLEEERILGDNGVLINKKYIKELLRLKEQYPYDENRYVSLALDILNEPNLLNMHVDELTEKQKDLLFLLCNYSKLDGWDPYGYRDKKCPCCNSRMLAGYDYIYQENGKKHKFNIKKIDRGLSKFNGRIVLKDYSQIPTYFCLQCGKEFGNLQSEFDIRE